MSCDQKTLFLNAHNCLGQHENNNNSKMANVNNNRILMNISWHRATAIIYNKMMKNEELWNAELNIIQI